ncbi:CheR family methyltransferase [Novosphingobium clariflavum]|uniref:Chemotaxis protein methyltransferase n=1 Tax=Novosphingobium clariflavum TaxID=2029884 RepID=A0ABV6S878_9SPHN|nr:protein-glutamate O-methyltransferase CheR [Novosphingobium clariflavum]
MNAMATATEQVPGVSPDIYGDADFAAIAKIVYDAVGIVLSQRKSMLVYSRLAPLVRETGAISFARYVEMMRADSTEMGRAVAALTTNHTFFYREAHHFEHLAEHVRPHAIECLRAGQPVRLWSAGCSSGEEVWSIVMTMLGSDRSAGLDMARRDFVLLASDIAPHALAKAEAATYAAGDLDPVPTALRSAWSASSGGQVRIADAARALVRFRTLNLQGEWPMKGRFDAIFCRNVMIYFDNETKERLVARYAQALQPGGFLYIGHSERVTGPATQVLRLVGPTIYQRSAA